MVQAIERAIDAGRLREVPRQREDAGADHGTDDHGRERHQRQLLRLLRSAFFDGQFRTVRRFRVDRGDLSRRCSSRSSAEEVSPLLHWQQRWARTAASRTIRNPVKP